MWSLCRRGVWGGRDHHFDDGGDYIGAFDVAEFGQHLGVVERGEQAGVGDAVGDDEHEVLAESMLGDALVGL